MQADIYMKMYKCSDFKYCLFGAINKQLLDEAEHDIKNYSDRGQCYLPKRS